MNFPLTAPTAAILAKAQFICFGDVAVHIPEGITISPQVHAEIDEFLKVIQLPVREAAFCALASLLDQHGVRLPNSPKFPTQ